MHDLLALHTLPCASEERWYHVELYQAWGIAGVVRAQGCSG